MQPSTPSWNDLRIFLEVARTGSFSRSARHLRMDVSTVSRHIAHLEQCLNMPVFERWQTGLKITPNGHAFIEHIEAMELHALALSDLSSSNHSSPSGVVRIGTMEGIGSFYLARQFVDFKSRYPLIKTELVTSAQHVHVSQREADLFLSFFPPEGRGLDVSPVGRFPLYLYASPAYLERRGTPQSVEDLVNHDFVSYIDDLVQLDTVRWLNEVVQHPHIVFHSSSMIAQMFSAAAAAGIVMLPAFMQAEHVGLQRILHEEGCVWRTVWLTVHRDLQYMPRIKTVTAFLRQAFHRDWPLPPGIVTTYDRQEKNTSEVY